MVDKNMVEVMDELAKESLIEYEIFYKEYFLEFHEDNTELIVTDQFGNFEFKTVAWLKEQDFKLYYADMEDLEIVLTDGTQLSINVF